jgi:hypothetical protein
VFTLTVNWAAVPSEALGAMSSSHPELAAVLSETISPRVLAVVYLLFIFSFHMEHEVLE